MGNATARDVLTQLDLVAELTNSKPKSQAAKGAYLTYLGSYGFDAIIWAISVHLQDPAKGRFFPTIADLKSIIERSYGGGSQHPSDDEAWAIALQSFDEQTTVIWTDEIAQAAAVAREVMPDKVGARMAFKATYNRLVNHLQASPVKWWPTYGADPQQRVVAVEQAVKQGLLPNNAASNLAIEYDQSAGEVTETSKRALEAIKQMVANQETERQQAREKQLQEQREREARLRAEHAQKYSNLESDNGV